MNDLILAIAKAEINRALGFELFGDDEGSLSILVYRLSHYSVNEIIEKYKKQIQQEEA